MIDFGNSATSTGSSNNTVDNHSVLTTCNASTQTSCVSDYGELQKEVHVIFLHANVMSTGILLSIYNNNSYRYLKNWHYACLYIKYEGKIEFSIPKLLY